MIYKLKVFVFLGLLCLVTPTIFAGEYLHLDDHVTELHTPLTLSATTRLAETLPNTAFIMTGVFDSKAKHQRHLVVIAGKVEFAGVLNDDAILVGGDVNFTETAVAHRDVRMMGGEVIVAGRIDGNLTVMSGEAIINGTVNGNVDVVAKSIQFGPQAKIIGRINYTSQQIPQIDVKAELMSAPTVTNVKQAIAPTQNAAKVKRTYAILAILSFGFLAFVWSIIFPKINSLHHELIMESPGKCLGLGLLTFFLLPLLSVFAMGTMIGITMGMLLVMLYIMLNTLGFVSMGFSIGSGLVKICQQPAWLEDKRILSAVAALGISVLVLVAFYVKYGIILNLLAALLGLGAMIQLFWQAVRSQSSIPVLSKPVSESNLA